MRLRSLILGTPPGAPTLVVLAILNTLQSGCTSCGAATGPASIQPREAQRQTATLPSPSSGRHLLCPTMGAPMVRRPSQDSGHRVILSWRDSAAADSRHDAAIGYCIYRGAQGKRPFAEPVNSVPFPGTSCADDWVEIDNRYIYEVKAISARGVASTASATVKVRIPHTPPPISSVSNSSVPLCRESAAVK